MRRSSSARSRTSYLMPAGGSGGGTRATWERRPAASANWSVIQTSLARSPELAASVDDEHLARHEVAVARQQMDQRALQVLRCLVARQGPRAPAPLHRLVVPRAQHVGEREPRGERVD